MTRPHLLDVLRDRVLLCDGAVGSRVQTLTLDLERDYWHQENCTEVLNLSRPDLVRDIHRRRSGRDQQLWRQPDHARRVRLGGPRA